MCDTAGKHRSGRLVESCHREEKRQSPCGVQPRRGFACRVRIVKRAARMRPEAVGCKTPGDSETSAVVRKVAPAFEFGASTLAFMTCHFSHPVALRGCHAGGASRHIQSDRCSLMPEAPFIGSPSLGSEGEGVPAAMSTLEGWRGCLARRCVCFPAEPPSMPGTSSRSSGMNTYLNSIHC